MSPAADVLERLEHSIGAIAQLDVDSLTDAELHQLTVTTQQLRDRLTAVTVPTVARWDDRAVWATTVPVPPPPVSPSRRRVPSARRLMWCGVPVD